MKNSNQHIIKRQWTIVQLLINGKYYSTADIQKHLQDNGIEITLRTIQKDLVELRKTFPLECRKDDKPYSWRWQPIHNKDGYVNNLTYSQAFVLKVVQNELSHIIPDDLYEQLQPLFMRANFITTLSQMSEMQVDDNRTSENEHKHIKTKPYQYKNFVDERPSEFINVRLTVDKHGNTVKVTALRKLLESLGHAKNTMKDRIRSRIFYIEDANNSLSQIVIKDTKPLQVQARLDKFVELQEIDLAHLNRLQAVLKQEDMQWLAEMI